MKTMSRFFRKPYFVQKTVCLLWAVCAVLILSSTLYAAEPAVQASGVNFTSVTDISMTVNWTRGDGDSCIVLMKAASAVDANPADGTGYTANAVFRYGSQVGTGNCAVYSGTGNSVNVIGLNPFTVYYVAVYECNGSGGTEDYLTPGAVSSTSTIDNRVWSSAFGNPGMDFPVNAFAVDGSGNLYAGGAFTTAGGVIASRIAKWDGSAWSALGTGINDIVYDLAVDGSGNLYAGGSFTSAGGVGVNRIAKWDGSAWSALGSGMDNNVLALAVDGSGNLYAGGDFTTAGGVSAEKIAKWNGSAWEPLGAGMSGAGSSVKALAVDSSGNLYAGGTFMNAGGVSAEKIAKWNGSAWEPLGTGMSSGAVHDIAAGGSGNLYAGGLFNHAGGVSVNKIAKWDGSAWSALGTGMNNDVLALAVDSRGNLYAGGIFTTAGGVSASYIAKWNGSAWSALGTGMNNDVLALAVDGRGNLYAGGSFTTAGGMISNRIARYNSVPASEPGTQASSVNFTSITGTSLTVNWTRGTGAECIVVMRPGSAVDSDPADWTGYTADAVFGNGSQIGTGNYVVYKGIGNTVTVTGLTAGTTYYAAVYEFNGYGGSEKYLTSTAPASGNATTAMIPPGNALNFDGVDDYVTVPDHASLNFGFSSYTLEAWIKTDDVTASQRILNKRSGADSVFDFALLGPNKILHLYSKIGTVGFDLYSNPNMITDNNWHHVAAAVARDGVNLNVTFYVDGLSVYSYSGSDIGNLTVATPMLIGCNNAFSNYFNGKMDEVRIWNTARSQAQIQDSMNNVIDPATSGLVAYYRFDHTSGTVLTDLTANANNGTLVSGPVWIPSTAFNVWTGAVNTDWNTAGNWSRGTVPAAEDNVHIPPVANQPIISTSNAFCNHLVTESGSTLTLAAGSDFLFVTGHVYSSGTITSDTGASYIVFSGTTPQMVRGSFTGNLLIRVQNTSNVILGANLLIPYGLYMDSGNVNLNGYTLSYAPGATLFYSDIIVRATTNAEFPAANGPTNLYIWPIGGISLHASRTIPGTVLISSETTFDANGFDFGFGGNWDNQGGTFVPGTGTVTLTGTNQTILGTNTFANLSKTVTAADTLSFDYMSEQTVTGTLTLQGASGNLLSLRSSSPGMQWNIDPQGTRSISYVDVQDSNNTNATVIDAGSTSVNSLNNINWLFLTAEPTTQATTVIFTAVDATSMTLNWINGSGTNRIVLVKAASAVDANPADGTGYTANTVFGSGDQIGTGNYAVYNGTGNTVTVTGLTPGLTYFVAVYEFNGTGGSENYLTSIAPAAGNATAAMTPPGNALDFDGADDSVISTTMTNFPSGNSAYTWEAWVYWRGDTGTSKIISWGAPYMDNSLVGIGMLAGGNVQIGHWNNDWSTNYTLPVNTWIHLAGTYDGSDAEKLYVNGSLQDTHTGFADLSVPINEFRLGQLVEDAFPEYFNGRLDEVRIWNVARTQAQIQNSMNNVIDPAAPGLVAYYRFDHISGTVLTDLTANANHGTLVNGPVWTDSEAFTVWTGAVSTDWNNPANWSDGVPTSADNAGIPPATPYSPEISTSGQCRHLVIQSGAVLSVPGTGVLNVYGNWMNYGTFNAGTGTVILSGQNQAVYGSNTFYILQKTGAGETLSFQSGTAQTVTTDLTLSNLVLKSTIPGTQWNIHAQGTVSASGLNVQDSNAVTLIDVRGQGCTDYGNNVNWLFDNTAPVINLDPDNSLGGLNDGNNEITFTEGGSPAAAADSDAAVTDAEDAVMQTLTLTVTGIADGADEIITIGGTAFPQDADKTADVTAGSTTFTVIYTQSTGVFLITGQGGSEMPLADLNTLIRGITYENLSAAPVAGNRSLSFMANDGFADSLSVLSVITVIPVNDAPVIESQNVLSVNEDTPLVIQLTDLIVTDPDNTYPDGFTLTVLTGTDYTVSGTQITPSANFNGTLTVPVLVNDGGLDSNIFNLTVTVNPVNDLPEITGHNPLSVNEDTPLVIQLTDLTVTDPDNTYPDGFSLTVQSGDNYTVSGTEITPSENFTGPLFVPVLVNDGTDDSAVFNLTVTVNAVNDPPEITGQNTLSVNEDTPLVIQLTDLIVTDPDNTYPDGFTLTVQTGIDYTVSGTEITPAENFTGNLTVPVLINDGTDDSEIFNLTVTVNAVNDAPIITNHNAVSTDEDTAVVIQLTDLIVTDPDNIYPADFTLTVQPGDSYTVSGTAVTPDLDFSGNLSVPVLVNDGTDYSNVFNISVTVNPVNDVPEITGQNTVSILEDSSLTLAAGFLLVSDPDNVWPDDFAITAGDGLNYTRNGNVITPVLDFTGDLTVPVTVNDGTADSGVFNFVISVTAQNDSPLIAGQNLLDTDEDTSLTVQLTDLIVTDPDSVWPADFTLTVLTGDNYTVSGNVITPSANYSGNLSVSVQVNDGENDSNVFSLAVSVNPVNDAPVINGQNALTIQEDTSVAIAAGFLLVSDPDNVWPDEFTITAGDGSNYTRIGNTITPNQDFTGVLTVPVTVNDGSADSNVFGFVISVSGENDSPLITGQNPLATNEDTSLTVQLTDLIVTDPDSDYPGNFTLTVQIGDNYTVSGTQITPAEDFNGVLTVPVMVNDGENDSNVFSLKVTVNPVNDAPEITGQNPVFTDEDTPLVIQLTDLTVNDPDNSYPAGFSLSVLPGNDYTVNGTEITPAEGFSGILHVDVMVSDGELDSIVYRLTVTVGAVNDAPEITGQNPVFTDEDTPLAIQLTDLIVTDQDSDYPDGFTLTVLSGSNYTVNGTQITPALNFTGILTVSVKVNDGELDSIVYSLRVTVNPVNDAPEIKGQNPVSVTEDTPFVIQLTNLIVTDPDSAYPADFTLNVQPGTNYTVSGNTVTPNRDFTGILTVPVTVNDGTADSGIFLFVITVTEKNDSPQITGQSSLSMAEDTELTVTLSDLTVYDPDSDYPYGFFLNIQPGSSYTVSGTTVIPAKNFNGILSVPATVNDGENESAVFYLSIMVTSVNDAPVITGQNAVNTAEDTAVEIQVSDLIVDDPDDTSFILSVQPGANYTVSGNTITPDREFSGVLSIPVSVSDGKAESSVFLLAVTVSDFSDLPVITGQAGLVTAEETDLTVTLGDLTVEDPDSEYPAEFTLTVLEGENYTVSGNTITPAKDFYGTLSVPVTVHDGKNSSTVFTLSVTVTNVNDQPQITSEPVRTATEDVLYRYEITFTDADPEDTLKVTAENLPGWLTLAGSVLSGTPGNDDTRKYEIVLIITDSGGMKTLQSFTLSVAAVNDAPVIIANNTLNTTEMTSLTVTLDDLIVNDPDSIYPEVFTMTLQAGENYTLEGHKVTPVQGFTGILTVPVSVNDGDDESSVYFLKITVTERLEIRTISGTVTGLEKDRVIFINAVSRSLNIFRHVEIRGTGEQVTAYSIRELKSADDYRVELSSTDYAYQVYSGKEEWEQADAVDITEKSAAGVDFVLTPPAGEISGRIFFPDTARAGQSVLIRAYSASTGSSGTAEIILDENGAWDVSYTISRLLHADDYTVSLSSDSYLTRYYSGDGGTGAANEKNAAAVSTRADAPEVNFVPDSGAVISGTVTGANVSGLRAEAWSDTRDAGSGAFISADGSYAISGLDAAEDYKVSVIRIEGSPVYYHPGGAVYDRNGAAAVSTVNGAAAGIDITIPEEKGISGTVRDAEGNPLSGIWVEAQSASQTAGGSAFTSADGTYEIQGLAPVSDYRVTARPDRHSLYSPQEINGIAAGTQNADFTLTSRPVFSISGLILDTDGEPVPNVRVEISSDSLDIFVTSTDDLSGMRDLHIPNKYDIDGLPAADDYTVTARPPANSAFAVFTRTGISIQEDTDMNIVLSPGFSMTGTVSDAARGSRIADARVMASSERKSFRAEALSSADGSFAIGNMPESADYSLTVTAEGYTDTEMPNLSPSGNIAAAMHSAGKISGTVTDENGSPLAGVPVEIFSQSMKSENHFSGNVLTDQNGKFAVKGLRRYSDAGNAVKDYTVTAHPENFPPAEAGNLRPDDTVNLKVTAGAEFSGTVRNADGSPLTGADVFIDIFEKQGAFVMTSDTNPDGTFSNASLRQDAEYELKFMVYSGEDLLMAQWAGNDGIGVNDQSSAAAYSPGTPLHFRFSETVQIPASRRRNAVHRAETSGETAVRNLRPVPLEVVYRDGTVTVKWESSLHGENPEAGEKYYCVFGTDPGLLISKRTAPRNRPVTVRTVTETGLTGDNADFHCHVAAVDARGQIGETRSVTFRTDTVPPLNPKISVPSATKESTVPLSLAAAGAAEVYLSNTAYGQGGQWETWTPQRAWKLTEGNGLKKIYGRFRDRAGNTVNAFAATEKIADFDPVTQHKIKVNAGSGGSADPSGEVIVNSGDDLTISVKPDAGYGTDQVTVDGIPVRLNNAGQFTLVSIRADHVFAVSFKPLSEKTHVITASAGSYGSIIPSGKVTVPEGADQKFVIVPVSGYAAAEVLADGQPVTLADDNTFIFRNVTAEHSISVSFK